VRLLAAAVTLAWALAWATAPGQAQQSGADDTIGAIRVSGNQRIEDQTVISYMDVAIGDSFLSARIDQSLKGLFATGLFADVSMRREGRVLVVQVVENPIINRLAFEGNKRIKDGDLDAEVQLRPRVVYTRTKVQKDVARILELYRRSGRFAAAVEPKVIQLAQNRVDLVFEIKEGPLTGVQRIVFLGNENFSDATLREIILTKQSRWWRFLSSSDNYDPDRLGADRDSLRQFYRREGYADFRVASAIAELTPDRENFYLTFTIDEGQRYRLGKMELESTLPGLNVDDIRDAVTTEEDDWYNAEEIEETIQALTDAVGALGYAFVDIRPQVSRDREGLSVDVTYHIEEGPRIYVQRIDITGNVRTLDRVIRRNVRLVEGDAFNAAKIRRSRQLIQNLNFFSRLDITNEPGDGPDRTVITIDVAEQSTGEINFGAGFSTLEGIIGSAGIRERNLLGRAQDLTLNFTMSKLTQDIRLGFTEPYFLNRDVSAGFDVFNSDREFRESSFLRDVMGFNLRLGYSLTEYLSQRLRYSLRSEEIRPFEGATVSVLSAQGDAVTSSIGQTLLYDKLDNRQDPTEGYFVSWSADIAGLGGSRKWFRNTVEAGQYYSVWDNWVLSGKAEVSHIFGLVDEDVEISDRFFLGGNSFRGFANAGVGPRDVANGNALGGNLLYKTTGEVSFPLGLPVELGVKGRAVTIVGTLTKVDETDFLIADEGSLRMSIGVGVSWASPFGPVRIDFARPVVAEDFDETEFVSFGFGSFF
jgi:outer membrane protein insertion porin family